MVSSDDIKIRGDCAISLESTFNHIKSGSHPVAIDRIERGNDVKIFVMIL
jgi:hypothetical protein